MSRNLTIEINLDNSAFQGFDEGFEIKRILEELAKKSKFDHERLRDINGNTVGFCKIEQDG